MKEGEILLPQALVAAILSHARAGYPGEVCGLVGRNRAGVLVAALPVQNDAVLSQCRYHMEPTSLYAAFTSLEANEWDLAAIYHSHPHSEAFPSAVDMAEAFEDGQPLYPDCLYLILSLADPAAPVLRAFRLVTPRHAVELPTRVVAA